MSNLMEQLINITDVIFLGQYGEVELGASALAGMYYLILYMLGFGCLLYTSVKGYVDPSVRYRKSHSGTEAVGVTFLPVDLQVRSRQVYSDLIRLSLIHISLLSRLSRIKRFLF